MSYLNRRQFVYGAGAVLGTTLVGCGKPSGDATGSNVTMFVNGTILPVDAAFSAHEALAIAGNKILAVGSRDQVLAAAGRGARTVDLAGRVVLPGFIEPHMHFALMAGMGHWPDIGPFRYETTAEALDALKAIAADTAPDEWVVARQFDPSLQEGPAMLTTRELDAVAADRPIFVLNASGHLAYGNSKLLEISGVGADTPNPPGGECFR